MFFDTPTHCPLHFIFGFFLPLPYGFTPPSFSPPCSLALSFPTLSLFSPTSCKISPCHLSVSLCMDSGQHVRPYWGLFVWVTMWVCICYFDKRRGGEGEGVRESEERRGGKEQGDWIWPCGWCFGIGTGADLQKCMCDRECVWDGIRSGQKTSSRKKGQKASQEGQTQ